LIVATTVPGTIAAQSSFELYRRVVPLEETTGVMKIRESIARQLEVPERCESDEQDVCTTVRRYAHIYRIDFEVETRKQEGDETIIEREERGSAHIALAAVREEEDQYDEQLRQALAQLGAAAFKAPFAGLRPGRAPFGADLAYHAVEPSWTCFDYEGKRRATEYEYEPMVRENGEEVRNTGTSTYTHELITGPLCAEMASVTEAVDPEEIRTMSTPQVQLEQTLTVKVSNMLLWDANTGELVALPEGAELSQQEAPGVSSGHSRGFSEGVMTADSTRDGTRTIARMPPAKLPPAAAGENAWHARWELRTFERHFGPLPQNHLLERWSMTASLLPTLPPRDLDRPPAYLQPAGSHAVRLDEEALFEAIAKSIDFRSELTPAVLADRIASRIEGLGPTGWILVICPTDGGATWGFPQVGAQVELLNGDLFCGAVESYLP
jgi:hypothetical protein